MDGDPKHAHRWAHVLTGAIVTRMLCAVLLWHALVHDQYKCAAWVFFFGCFTDAVDGYLARRLGVLPSLGPYADASADFVLVMAAFSGFVIKGMFPSWTLVLISLMFLQFVWTSGRKRPLYDPVGKYYGVFLFGVIGITLLFNGPLVHRAIPVALLGFSAFSVVGRVAFLIGGSGGSGSAG